MTEETLCSQEHTADRASGRSLRLFEPVKHDLAISGIARLGNRFENVNTLGNAETNMGKLIYTIVDFDKVGGIKPSTIQLFYTILEKFTDDGSRSPRVEIPISEYMTLRGLKDRQEAIKRARDDLKVLSSLRIDGSTPKSRYEFVNIADSGSIPERGSSIVFKFGSTFFEELQKMSYMLFPRGFFKLNTQKYPHSVCFLQKIADMKHLNRGKNNEDIISVKSLLASSPYLPTYQEVEESDRHFKRRIINQFEKNMNALSEVLQWEYCYRTNCPLEKHEAENLTYNQFSELKVHIMWNYYPEQEIKDRKPVKRAKRLKEHHKKQSL